ncbi:hypothetical protein DIZ76_015755 [Coccidioides immitis]|nr:hypothetical protein DIZ76_015755 [Coccidioides immitis]
MLRVNIALGGWTFNDPGPTASTFSDLARSEENQKKCFKSLISFMATYDFDGVDLDWEYPVDADRGGRPEDFGNFPKFMANLKKALKSTSGRDELSVTLPASYWYLQHFDLKKLSPHVDYFNIMSYDLHGTWDKGNKWTGNFLNAHTDLTEIDQALNLICRNNIDPGKVVMGLGFYGRAFTVETKSCVEPGCFFASGADPGPCSSEAGVLLNNEIDDIMRTKNIKPTFDEEAAVKILTWDDQWVSFDDEETLALKTDYARLRCLGGSWCGPSATTQRITNTLKHLPKALTGHLSLVFLSTMVKTCMSQSRNPSRSVNGLRVVNHYPSGYHMVDRLDKEARDGEMMLDETGCPRGGGVHVWCCPNSYGTVKCGWYRHNNGKCSNECPRGQIEIGSNSMYCNNLNYQAACCEFEKRSMHLYTNLEWSKHPDCDSGVCPFVDQDKDQVLTCSRTGSGGATCKAKWITRTRYPQIDDYESRAL